MLAERPDQIFFLACPKPNEVIRSFGANNPPGVWDLNNIIYLLNCNSFAYVIHSSLRHGKSCAATDARCSETLDFIGRNACHPPHPRSSPVNKLCIRFYCHHIKPCQTHRSSLKELSCSQATERTLRRFRIIPGDWGKVRSGWLVWLLLKSAQAGEWRQDSPVPLAAFARRQLSRNRNCAARSD